MSREPATALPRRDVNARRAETVERLLLAAATLLDEMGHDDLAMRTVAQRAGVSPATVYSYFASKDHLLAALFWRKVVLAGDVEPSGDSVTERLQQCVQQMAALVAESPNLAAAVSKGFLGSEPDVIRLRTEIGLLWNHRLASAIGNETELGPEVVRTLLFAVSGAFLQAGIGVFPYEDLGDALSEAVAVVMRGSS